MSETPTKVDANPYERWSTDSLVDNLRDIACGWTLQSPTNGILRAAADRLHALHHAEPMSAGVLSESDAVRRERDIIEAKRSGFASALKHYRSDYSAKIAGDCAKSFYPLPRVERPRIVRDYLGLSWRIVGTHLQCEKATGEWVAIADVPPLADLFANPVELVDADACGSVSHEDTK